MTERKTQFGFNDGGILFSIAVALMFLYQIALSLAIKPSSQVFLWAYSFGTPVIFVLTSTVGALVMRVNPLKALPIAKAPKPREAGRAILLAILAVLAFLPLATAVQWLFGLMGYRQAPVYADYSSTWWRMLLGLVGIALLPAIGEEFLFRGVVYGSIRRKGTVYAVFLTALLFALLRGSPVQFIHQFLIGCIMAFLVYQTECLWTSVLFHFVNNAVIILYEFVYKAACATYTIPWWVYLVMFVVAAPLLVLVLLKTGLRKPTDQEGDPVPMVAAPSLGRGGAFWAKRGEYIPYQANPKPFGLYVAFAIVGIIWLANTIVGWKGV